MQSRLPNGSARGHEEAALTNSAGPGGQQLPEPDQMSKKNSCTSRVRALPSAVKWS